MKSILEQLYDGEIFPAEQFNIQTEEYRALRKQHYSHYEDFIKELKNLTPPLDEKFIEIMDEQFDTIPFETAGTFVIGFRLGAKIMMEVLQDSDMEKSE